MRSQYDDEENPIGQVVDYATEIREKGEVLGQRGRPLRIRDTTPMYAYIVADMTPAMRRFGRHAGLRPTPDALGLYDFNDELKLFIEVISYNKLLIDAKRRNRAFFEKLGIPIP